MIWIRGHNRIFSLICQITSPSQWLPFRILHHFEAAQVQKNILPIGKKDIPESQLRLLVSLKDNPGQQRNAWQKAVATAPDGKVTAAHVQKVVKEMTETAPDLSSAPPDNGRRDSGHGLSGLDLRERLHLV
jgi:hypothetical protein